MCWLCPPPLSSLETTGTGLLSARGGDFPQADTIIFSLTVQVPFLTHRGGGISLRFPLSLSRGSGHCLKMSLRSGVLPLSVFVALLAALLPEVGRL